VRIAQGAERLEFPHVLDGRHSEAAMQYLGATARA
jgi:hypothetical protein